MPKVRNDIENETNARDICAMMNNTVDDVRAKSVMMLGEAMNDRTALLDVAHAIELIVFEEYNSTETDDGENSTTATNEYRKKIRTMTANLKRNEKISERLRKKVLTARDVVHMSESEFMTDELRAKVEKIREKSERRAERVQFADGILSQSYVCEECHSNECKFVHLSDSRDNRKAETWGGNGDGDSKVLVRCEKCLHEWRAVIL